MVVRLPGFTIVESHVVETRVVRSDIWVNDLPAGKSTGRCGHEFGNNGTVLILVDHEAH